MSFLRDIFAVPSEQAQNALKLGARICQQLEEKKQRVKTLADTENLLADEEKFCKLMSTTFDRLPESDQWHCLEPLADLAGLAVERGIVERYRKEFIAERTKNLRNLYKIEKLEGSLKPRPNVKVESVLFYTDGEIEVKLSEEIPEGEYRIRQAVQYFSRLLRTHCNLFDPTLDRSAGIYPGADGNRYQFTPKFMGVSHYEVDTLKRRKIITRCPSRDFIFNPKRTFYQEYERIVTQFIEESLADPQGFTSADQLSIVPTKYDLRLFLPSNHELVAEPSSEIEEPVVDDDAAELAAEVLSDGEEPKISPPEVD